MAKMKDEVGNRYGMLTVDRLWKMDHRNGAIWICVCDCGEEFAVSGKDLRRGNAKSCGCLRRMPFDERAKLGFWHGKEKMA